VSDWRGWTRTRRRVCRLGDEAPASAIADEVGLEPAGQPVFAGGSDESIGDEDKGPVGEGDAFGLAEGFVKDGPEVELIEQGAESEDGTPGGGVDDLGIGRRGVLLADVAAEQSLELGEDLDEEIFAAEIGDDALLDLWAFAVGFDDPEVLVECAAGGADFDGSQVYVVKYHDRKVKVQGGSARNIKENRVALSLHFSGREGAPP
jgi:hypothetical protein